MDLSPVANSLFDQAWSPPWQDIRAEGRFVAASLQASMSTVLELPQGTDRARQCAWIADWLEQWLAARVRSGIDQPVTFVYLVLKSLPAGREATGKVTGDPVAEFGFGASPRAPESWRERSLNDFLREVIIDLGRTGPLN